MDAQTTTPLSIQPNGATPTPKKPLFTPAQVRYLLLAVLEWKQRTTPPEAFAVTNFPLPTP